ncbi:MAG: hypothetical protein ACI92Z_002851 [Paracoccaceae bacterium]
MHEPYRPLLHHTRLDKTGGKCEFAASARIILQQGESSHSQAKGPGYSCCGLYQELRCADSELAKSNRSVKAHLRAWIIPARFLRQTPNRSFPRAEPRPSGSVFEALKVQRRTFLPFASNSVSVWMLRCGCRCWIVGYSMPIATAWQSLVPPQRLRSSTGAAMLTTREGHPHVNVCDLIR